MADKSSGIVELIKMVFEAWQSGDIQWLAIFLVVVCVTGAAKIVGFLELLERGQIRRLQEALSSGVLDDKFRGWAADELQREYFFAQTRVYAGTPYRDRLIELLEESEGRLRPCHIRRASRYLRPINNPVAVRLGKLDILDYWANRIFAVMFLCIGSLFLLTSVSGIPLDAKQIMKCVGAGSGFMFLAWLFNFQTFPVYSVRKIQAEAKRQEDEKTKKAALHSGIPITQ